MGTLTEYLKGKAAEVRSEAARRKAALDEWRAAVYQLMTQLQGWVFDADPEGVLRCVRTETEFVDHDLQPHRLTGLQISLGDTAVRVVPTDLTALGMIRLPTNHPNSIRPARINGRVDFETGTDRVPLYWVKVGDRNEWYWWRAGGVGEPLDRESFEATLVSLLR